MQAINIRYGESVTLPVTLDDTTATDATLYVGKAGEAALIAVNISLTDGAGIFELTPEDTSIPLGTYKYQVTVVNEADQIEKYPNPEDCGEDGLPEFKVYEALDSDEVTS